MMTRKSIPLLSMISANSLLIRCCTATISPAMLAELSMATTMSIGRFFSVACSRTAAHSSLPPAPACPPLPVVTKTPVVPVAPPLLVVDVVVALCRASQRPVGEHISLSPQIPLSPLQSALQRPLGSQYRPEAQSGSLPQGRPQLSSYNDRQVSENGSSVSSTTSGTPQWANTATKHRAPNSRARRRAFCRADSERNDARCSGCV